MTSPIPEKLFGVGLYMLVASGILLMLCGMFCIGLGIIEPHGRHGAGGLVTMSALGVLLLLDGFGLLMPQLGARLLSSVLLAAAAGYLFCSDAFRRENWWIYSLLFCPLVLTLGLRSKNNGSPIQDLSNAN